MTFNEWFASHYQGHDDEDGMRTLLLEAWDAARAEEALPKGWDAGTWAAWLKDRGSQFDAYVQGPIFTELANWIERNHGAAVSTAAPINAIAATKTGAAQSGDNPQSGFPSSTVGTKDERGLLACPFCTATPLSMWVGNSVPGMEDCGYWSVECRPCGRGQPTRFVGVHGDDQSTTEARWNDRCASSATAVRQDEIDRTLKMLDSSHVAFTAGTGYDPKKYSSHYSEAADLIRRLTGTALDGGKAS